MTAYESFVLNGFKWLGCATAIDRERAAWPEAAAHPGGAQIRQLTGNRGEPLLSAINGWYRGEQPFRVGVNRVKEHIPGLAALDDLAGIEHRHMAGNAPYDPKVVADEHHRQPAAALQLLKQIQDLRLDCDIERRGGFVQDKQVGLGRKRTGQQGALPHTTGQFVRIGPGDDLRAQNTDFVEQLDGAPARVAAAHAQMVDQAFADLISNGERRIQDGKRILKHQPNPLAPQLATLLDRQGVEILAIDQNAPTRHIGLGRQQPHRGERDRALA